MLHRKRESRILLHCSFVHEHRLRRLRCLDVILQNHIAVIFSLLAPRHTASYHDSQEPKKAMTVRIRQRCDLLDLALAEGKENTHQLVASEATPALEIGQIFKAFRISGAAVSATKHAGSISTARVMARMKATKLNKSVASSKNRR